jgi:dsDNA-binding SOS-regulon protein
MVMQYEILPVPQNYSVANDQNAHILSQAQRKERDSYDAQLDELVEQQLENGNNNLETLLQSAPPYLQAELRQLFAQKLAESRKHIQQNLTPAQQKILQHLLQAEAQIDMLPAQKRQMRALILRNPQLLDVIIALANVLIRHGITGITQSQPQISAPSATPTIAAPNKQAVNR